MATKPANRIPLITVSELALPFTAMLVLAGMVAPVGPMLLDVLLSFSLALSLVVLVVAASNRTALDFSAFPTVLLIATLLRLSLNVAVDAADSSPRRFRIGRPPAS